MEGAKMQCPKCQFENREEAMFCSECGYKFEITCPKCESKIRSGSKFCDECGEKIAELLETPSLDYTHPQSYTPKFLADKILKSRSSIEGERKLVTVLFADVANSTAIFEKIDPEEVHQIMDGCFRILMDEIHRYEGTINQFTGDGVMAILGAPIAHEDHAQRACYASLNIQKAALLYAETLKNKYGIEFKMRIGLNSGSVVVGSIGDDLRMDYTADGDVTNLANRMESRAEPGGILVSGATHKLVKDFFEFTPLGKVEVKGKEQPQEAYQLIKAGEIQTRFRASVAKGLTKFVGRKNSMEALRGLYERVLSGSGQVVGITGEAGVGKSRLLLEFIDHLSRGEYTYFEGGCLHYGSDMIYLPIIEILRSYFEIKEGDREIVIKDKLDEKSRQSDHRLSGILPSFQELLSVKVDDEKHLQLDPGEKKLRIFESIRDLFVRESEQKPLVLAIEDLHWVDKTSEECISYLIDWLANTRILLILLYRSEYTHKWGSKSYYTKVGLTQLGTASRGQLVQAILEGGEVVPELREFVLSRSGSNPLFVEELIHSLLENDIIQKKNHQYVLTRSASDIHVPDTIQGIIAARIDRIDEGLKHVMQVASVIGREFAFRILQAIMGMREELKSHLLNLQGLEFISEKRLFPELEYIFKHALTQEVAYNSLLQRHRKKIHKNIGNAIEELYPDRLEEFYELLAYHYEQAEIHDKAIHYLIRAADRAKAIYANDEAIAYYRKAAKQLGLLPRKEGELNEEWRKIATQLYESLAETLELIGQHSEALKTYESALIHIPNHDSVWRAHLHRKTGNVWREQRCYEEALQAYDLAEIVLGKETIDSAQEWWQAWIEIQSDRMWLHYWQAQFQHMAALAEKARPAVEQYGTPDLRSRFFQGLVIMAQRRDRYVISEETMADAQATLEAIRESGKPSAIALAQFTLGFNHLWRDELDEAEEDMQAALKLAERIGDVVVQSRCLTYLTILYRKRGQSEEVQNYISRALDVATAGNMLEYISTAKANLAWVKWYMGNLSEAQENGRIALEIWQQAPLVYPFKWTALWPLISVAHVQYQVSEAVDYARTLLEPAQQRLPDALTALLEKAIKSWEGGETETAHTYLNQAIELAQELGWF
jgi:class 3 adenylate cyclase/tetratricopeptide (TPR) repeat protein